MYNVTNWAFNAEPADEAKNHIDIICDINALGANLVVTDNPTGEINISPMITKAHEPTNQSGETLPAVPNNVPGKVINKNDAPANIKPIANFIGDEGWFFVHLTHNQAKNGV